MACEVSSPLCIFCCNSSIVASCNGKSRKPSVLAAPAAPSVLAAPAAPSATVTAQGHAAGQWRAGTDPAGRQAATITAPALIADGTADRLDPLANSQTLARLIPGAKLTLYADAGHAFLFQDQAAFITLIESFPG